MYSMGGHPRDPQIEAHIELISSRAEPDSERLVAAMLNCSWPGGPGDRSEPVALEWVRLWGPGHVGLIPLACSCAAGRCRVCN
jgi:hypothetical protein